MRILRIVLSAIISAVLLAGPSPAWGAARQNPAAKTPGPAAAGGWWAAVQQNIRSAEYTVTWQDRTYLPALRAAYQAPNRAHNLRTYFTPHGIRSIPRTWTGTAPDWEWGLRLIAVEAGGHRRAPSTALVHVSDNRVEFRRGGVTEWYVNDDRGVEQGFTLAAPLGPARSSDVIRIDLAVTGTLTPELGPDGRKIYLATRGGSRVLQYSSLTAADATDRILPARMEVDSSSMTIRLIVDASGAAYPITVDPLISAVAANPIWTGEANQDFADFGYSVATAGDVNGDGFSDVIVGAFFYDNGQTDEGRAYVYHGSASGPAASPAWVTEGNQVGARLGYSVATAGDVNGDGFSDVIVGAPYYDNAPTDEGRAFVFHGSAGGLSVTAAWTAEGNQASALFGWSVATAGDVNADGFSDVIVGTWAYDNGQTNEGRAFVYHGSVGGLGTSTAWTAENNQASSEFGWSVGTAGDVNGDGYSDVIVSARGHSNGQSQEGRAYVYHGSSAGLNLSPAWTAESDQNNARFGSAVATAGDVNGDGYADVIVGAVFYDNGQTDEGRAFAYYGSGTGLGLVAAWSAESNQANARFGGTVGTAGDVNGDGYADVVVGVDGWDGFHANEGRAELFQGSALGLVATLGWAGEGNQTSAQFGNAVATAGDVNGDGFSDVIIGAFAFDNGHVNEGRAFVFLGSPDSLRSSSPWVGEANQISASFGQAAASAGDVNGDGYADVIVGAYAFDNGEGNEGRAFVYHGSGSGLSTTPAWTAESNQAGAWFGVSVGTAGDVNGDGYTDVIVGAPFYDNGQVDEGRAFVYHGSATGLGAAVVWTRESNQAFANFGRSVATAGDVNGDGFADVIVGADAYDNGQTNEGRAFVYHGSSGGLSLTAAWTAERNQANAYFGRSVASAGDVNRDGFSDVLVGAYLYDGGFTNSGLAVLHLGSSSGLNVNSSWSLGGSQNFEQLGTSVASAGDVNGDGYADVIIGAPSYDGGQVDEGRVVIYHGYSGGLPAKAAPNRVLEINQASAFFGESAASAGDVNGDGYSDVIVGAMSYDFGQTNEGLAVVHHGSPSGVSAIAAWNVESNQSGAFFGGSVAAAGDVNGDGFGEVIVGAEGYDNGQTDEGLAFVYYGGGGGVRYRPRQLRVSGGPIAHLGKSDRSDGFVLAVRGRTPFGRDTVKMQVEVKPLGTAFDGTGLQQTQNWQDSGVNGVNMSRTVGGLLPMTAYHWRIRILYHPARAPFQRHSRWLTMPWNGWNEKDLRTF